MANWIGIDISKAKYDVHWTNGKERASETFDNTIVGHKKLQKWLRKRGAADGAVCMEATGSYGDEVALSLHQAGYKVSVMNPRIIKKYAEIQLQRNKTDKLDARLLATYCEREQPRAWEPPTAQVQKLRALTRHLDDLKETRTSQINRLKSGSHPAEVTHSLQSLVDLLTAQIKTLKQQIADHIDQHPDLKGDNALLVSISGIGATTAAVLLAELPTITHFSSPKQLAAYAGLTPQQLQSGQARRTNGIIKIGNKHLRTALYFPAVSALTHNPPLARFAQRLLDNGKHKMSVIAALMRKLLHIVFAVLKNKSPFDPDYVSPYASVS